MKHWCYCTVIVHKTVELVLSSVMMGTISQDIPTFPFHDTILGTRYMKQHVQVIIYTNAYYTSYVSLSLYIYIYIYVYVYTCISISLSLYTCIYIYIERERERDHYTDSSSPSDAPPLALWLLRGGSRPRGGGGDPPPQGPQGQATAGHIFNNMFRHMCFHAVLSVMRCLRLIYVIILFKTVSPQTSLCRKPRVRRLSCTPRGRAERTLHSGRRRRRGGLLLS